MSDRVSLDDDLDPAARRRLWFLQQIIENRGFRDADAILEYAERLEEFVLRGQRFARSQRREHVRSHVQSPPVRSRDETGIAKRDPTLQEGTAIRSSP